MKISLYLTIFVSGAVVMVLEIVGSRLLAPYVGTSIIAWTSLIGVVLGSLSLGYYLGGMWADRDPNIKQLARLALASGILIGLIPLVLRLAKSISGSESIYLSSIGLSLILFTPATIVLGMITPYATRLSLSEITSAGGTVGRIYALSTIGSIAGTFLAGFVLIPAIGSSRIIISLSLTMLLLFLILLWGGKSRKFPKEIIMGVAIIPLLFVNPSTPPVSGLVIDTDTPFSRTWVYDTELPDGRIVRSLTNSIYGTQSLMLLDDPSILLASYLEMFRDLTHLFSQVQAPSTALALGGSTYTFPRAIIGDFPELELEVVEIDPGVTELAEDFFNLKEDKRLRIIHEDGRIFLNKADKKYALVYIDAFQADVSIPFHLVTREAVEHLARITEDSGMVMKNFLAAPESELIASFYSTYLSEFPYVHVIQVNPRAGRNLQNYVLVGTRSKALSEMIERDISLRKVANIPRGEIFTDDYAPIEHFTLKLLR